jgi:hypothetical protein
MEEQKKYEKQEDCDDYESGKKQHPTIFFTLKQLEVLLKMNRLDFIGLVEAFKRGKFKSVTFKLVKPRNFDKVRYQKVVDVWLAKIEHYFHANKLGDTRMWNLFSPI